MRAFLIVGLLAIVVVTTGCAPEAEPDPGSSRPSHSPGATTPAQTPPAPPASPPTAPADEVFTSEQLVELCVAEMRPAFDDDVSFTVESARVIRREVEPPWLVLVPAHTLGYDAEAVCTIGGAPQSPVFELANASIDPLSDQEVQGLIDGTHDFGGS